MGNVNKAITNDRIKHDHPIVTWGQPDYSITFDSYESVYVYRDEDETDGSVTYVIDYYDRSTPEDEELRALLFSDEPRFDDLMWYIRETVCEMMLGEDADYRECWDFEDSLVIYDHKYGRVA